MKIDIFQAMEKHARPLLLCWLLIASISGFVTYFFEQQKEWQQWTYLLHTFSGIVLGILIVPYVLSHLTRTFRLRPLISFASGWIGLLALLGLTGSGVYIVVFGQSESLDWIETAHIGCAYVALSMLAGHLLWNVWVSSRGGRSSKMAFPLTLKELKHSIQGVMVCAAAVILATVIYDLVLPDLPSRSAIEPYELPYSDHPFRPGQTETKDGRFVKQYKIAGSDQCSSCHKEIARQWQASIHSQAASDPAYVTNINFLVQHKGIAAARYCEGCHAPIALLTGELTRGGNHGGIPGTIAHKQGVSCMSCHGIEKIVHLKGVGSYQWAPAATYLFAGLDNPLLQKINHFLIRIHPRQHRMDMSRNPLGTSQMCASCHEAFMDKDMNNWGWVKLQNEYTAWLNGPYSGQSEQVFSHSSIKRCQDCHMPLISGEDPSADTNGKIVSHYTPGGNTAIPSLLGNHDHFLLVKEFLQSDKMNIAIDDPQRKDAERSQQFLQKAVRANKEPPAYLYLGENASIKVVVTNTGVGHNFPGGTIDINQAWIHFRVVDAENELVYENGRLSRQQEVGPNAFVYQSIPIDRFGRHVWKHDLFNMAGESFHHVIPAGKSDTAEYSFQVPYWAKNPLTVSAVLRYRKFNQKYARWALDDERVELPIIDMARDAIHVPIRIRSELEKGKE
ncbi:MAG: hypothetical protein HQM14_01785 [SAR324 cluster bacterium]|nr:hypothetical protein [SAR324 cluster bacterium]